MSPERGDGGTFASKVADSDVLGVLRSHEDPVATAGELSAVLDVSSETVRRRLTALHERGQVARKTVGARAVVWWSTVDDRDDGSDVDDPLFDLPTFAGERPTDVSASVDEHLAAAIPGEGDDDT